jgi:hypothetical protein
MQGKFNLFEAVRADYAGLVSTTPPPPETHHNYLSKSSIVYYTTTKYKLLTEEDCVMSCSGVQDVRHPSTVTEALYLLFVPYLCTQLDSLHSRQYNSLHIM